MKAMERLKNDRIVCQTSNSPDARQNGNGYLYFTLSDGKPFPTTKAAQLIRDKILTPMHDGLFGTSQTYGLNDAEEADTITTGISQVKSTPCKKA